ncbi:MAG: NAD(P)/FAD-dependent oxidoreductase [Leptolyngbyaceae cyanobacterium SL_7_1]|nr:NAD(P)/FAD-dependent oxidoreductase [Leptolyngbyaceae cyanobacterium SL_7_1]
MSFDYDLVILGGTIAAREAAVMARSWGARVAIVAPSPAEGWHWAEDEGLWSAALAQLAQLANPVHQACPFGVDSLPRSADETPSWSTTVDWLTHVLAQGRADYSPTALTLLGIEIIFGQAAFQRQPRLGVRVGDRLLIARTYLIAVGSQAVQSKSALPTLNPITVETLWKHRSTLPARIAIVGEEPIALELAQALTRFGSQVTLLTHYPYLLPREDGEAAQLIQSYLEAEGIRVLTQTPLQQLQWLPPGKGLQVGDWTIAVEELLTTHRVTALDTLNLGAAGVVWHGRGIPVNQRLQTSNPRIYACGEALGGYSPGHLAEYEAAVAVKNALFIASHRIDRSTIPFTLLTSPRLARVGLTEPQARQRYGRSIQVITQTVKSSAKAQILDQPIGFCKFLVRPTGEMVGAHWVGVEADEGIGAIALAMKHRITLGELAFQLPALTACETITQAAMQWKTKYVNPRWRDWAEGWFNLRRR